MRRLIGILLALCFLLTIFVVPLPVGAKVPGPGDPNVRTAKFWIGKKFYEVNGVRQTMDVAPVIKNGRTLLPLRYVGYAMGLKEQDVSWEPAVGWARLKRWYGTGDYDYDEVIFRTRANRSKADYILNGWDYTAKLDVPAEVVPPGRTMVPFRAAVHALGGLAFWDGKEQSVTVVTWEKPPKPVEQKVKKVEATLDKAEARVTYLDGSVKTVPTERPAAVSITRPNGNRGYMLNAVEWFKLWGVPEEAMLFDPVRGGLIVRGAATHNNPLDGVDRQASTYCAFYAGEKPVWDAFFKRYPTTQKALDKDDPMYVANGSLYGGYGVTLSGVFLWGAAMDMNFIRSDDSVTVEVFVK